MTTVTFPCVHSPATMAIMESGEIHGCRLQIAQRGIWILEFDGSAIPIVASELKELETCGAADFRKLVVDIRERPLARALQHQKAGK
jgi:hypothetical protein